MCVVVVLALAIAVVQAGASEVPQSTKTLGAKNTRQLINPLMMKDPSSLLTELQEMVHSGGAPAFDMVSMIKSTIQDAIMPGLQATRNASASETTEHLDAIQLCNNQSKTRADEIAGSIQESVNTARSLHAACRDAQKTMYHHNLTNADSYCVKLGKFLHEAKPLSITTGYTRADAVNYVKSVSINANMCGGSVVTELADNCTGKEEELRSKETECLQKQKYFEEVFCTWKEKLELSCQDLDSCHSTAVTAYWHHVDKTETLLEKWDVETAALHKILCYCNVWLSDMDEADNRSQHNATHFDVCKDQTHTADPVDHGTPAAKVACPLDSVVCHPGKTCFVQEYSGFFDFVATVVPCTQGSVVPTTEAPTTEAPTTEAPTTEAPATTEAPTTKAPTTEAPTTEAPTTEAPATEAPTTEAPTTEAPTTEAPTTDTPTTEAPATEAPTTEAPTTEAPTTEAPATEAPATEAPTTEAPTTEACNWDCYLARYPDLQKAFGNDQGAADRHYTDHGKTEGRDCTCSEACNWDCYVARYPDLQKAFGNDQGAANRHYTDHGKAEGRDCTCSEAPTTEPPTTEAPTTDAPTTEAPTTEAPTTEAPTTEAPTTEAPTTEAPTTEGRDLYTFGEKGMLDGCPLGYSGIFGATVCKQAADDLGYYMRSGTSKHGNAYPGCYFYESSKMAYFNTHPDPDGTWHTANAGQICMLEAATAAPSP